MSTQEITTANDLLQKTQEIIKKTAIPDRHSFFQMEKFMIGREPTTQAQVWQIVREMQVRTETIDSYLQQLDEAEDNLELFDINIERINRQLKKESETESPFGDLNIQEFEINIRKLQRQKESLVKSARKVRLKLKYVLEELAFLAQGYEKIVSRTGEPRPFDDDQAQREMWNEKLLEEYNLRVILQRPLEPEFVKTVLCLGDDAPVKRHVENMLVNVQQKMIALQEKHKSQKPQANLKPHIEAS